ncbi:MAG: hypothetical protein AAB655_01480, partial [Patescibacteria group bacterium]
PDITTLAFPTLEKPGEISTGGGTTGSSGCNVATFSGSSYTGSPGSGGGISFICTDGRLGCPGLVCTDSCKNFSSAGCK